MPEFRDDPIIREKVLKKSPELLIPNTVAALNMLVGETDSMLELKDRIKKVMLSSYHSHPCLILGETGTGKELVAKALHKGEKFCPVNCAAIPEQLLESILFGHKKGAFTGAQEDRQGLFEYANNGTVFLDEIGDMQLNLQAKLLRVLQEKVITPIGGHEIRPVTCKVICATHKNLKLEVDAGNFRRDLFYRISPITFNITPLRSRPDDIEELCGLLDEGNPKLSQEFIERVKTLPLHGNFRELESYVIRYKLFGEIPQV